MGNARVVLPRRDSRQCPEFLQRPGGITSRLGAIHEHVIPTGIRRVEPVTVEIKVADLRMTNMEDSQTVTHVPPVPEFAETRTGIGQFGYQRPHPRIPRTGATELP